MGTVDYVAPEQIRGDQVDGRADVYALGCLLFETLTGTLPFTGASDVAVVYAHLEEEPPRASERRPGLPPEVDEVLARAMAKDPGERQPSCGALVTRREPRSASFGRSRPRGDASWSSRCSPPSSPRGVRDRRRARDAWRLRRDVGNGRVAGAHRSCHRSRGDLLRRLGPSPRCHHRATPCVARRLQGRLAVASRPGTR